MKNPRPTPSKSQPCSIGIKMPRNCRWFTRGWTLQELLAPRHVEFYDGNWVFRGTKRDLKELIADPPQIRTEVG